MSLGQVLGFCGLVFQLLIKLLCIDSVRGEMILANNAGTSQSCHAPYLCKHLCYCSLQ